MTPEEARRLATVEAEVEAIKESLAEMGGDVKSILAMANRWRGGMVVLLAVGGMIGWAADKLIGLIPGNHT